MRIVVFSRVQLYPASTQIKLFRSMRLLSQAVNVSSVDATSKMAHLEKMNLNIFLTFPQASAMRPDPIQFKQSPFSFGLLFPL